MSRRNLWSRQNLHQRPLAETSSILRGPSQMASQTSIPCFSSDYYSSVLYLYSSSMDAISTVYSSTSSHGYWVHVLIHESGSVLMYWYTCVQYTVASTSSRLLRCYRAWVRRLLFFIIYLFLTYSSTCEVLSIWPYLQYFMAYSILAMAIESTRVHVCLLWPYAIAIAILKYCNSSIYATMLPGYRYSSTVPSRYWYMYCKCIWHIIHVHVYIVLTIHAPGIVNIVLLYTSSMLVVYIEYNIDNMAHTYSSMLHVRVQHVWLSIAWQYYRYY